MLPEGRKGIIFLAGSHAGAPGKNMKGRAVPATKEYDTQITKSSINKKLPLRGFAHFRDLFVGLFQTLIVYGRIIIRVGAVNLLHPKIGFQRDYRQAADNGYGYHKQEYSGRGVHNQRRLYKLVKVNAKKRAVVQQSSRAVVKQDGRAAGSVM
jgi:hypothetical protein